MNSCVARPCGTFFIGLTAALPYQCSSSPTWPAGWAEGHVRVPMLPRYFQRRPIGRAAKPLSGERLLAAVRLALRLAPPSRNASVVTPLRLTCAPGQR